MTISQKKEWIISFWSALVFLIISSPLLYKITNIVTYKIGFISSTDGKPNIIGLILHTIVFLLLVRFMMEIKLPGV